LAVGFHPTVHICSLIKNIKILFIFKKINQNENNKQLLKNLFFFLKKTYGVAGLLFFINKITIFFFLKKKSLHPVY
jgi:hypothetical protein